MAAPIDVFISRKSSDVQLAKELYDYLTGLGLVVFDSDENLPKLGNSDYRKEIDKALSDCKHLVVVGSSYDNISSSWVEAEWGFYINEKRAGRKQGNILTLITDGLEIASLPASLRYYQVIKFDPGNFQRISAYLGKESRQSTMDKAEGPERKEAARVIVTIPDPAKKRLEAQKTNRTDFGSLGQTRSNGQQDLVLQTDRLHFTLHNNGTFTDELNKLMWVQAPWGMVWDGAFFIGEPVSLSWYDATKMFGKGVFVQRTEVSTTELGDGILPPELMGKASRWNGYNNGNCQVSFAGYTDWRLPTCDEFYKTILQHQFFNSKAKDENKREKEILKQVFGDWESANRFWNYFFWTANGRIYADFMEKLGFDNKVAWKAAPARGQVSDDRKELNYCILFARNI